MSSLMPELNGFDPNIREYLLTGELPRGVNLFDLPINSAMAIEFVRMAQEADKEAEALIQLDGKDSFVQAHQAKDTADRYRLLSKKIRHKSDDEIDFHMVDEIMSSETVNVDTIIDFLKQKQFTEIPVLSNTPQEIIDQFAQHFQIIIVPADQIDFIDYEQFLRPLEESQVPDWFRQVKADIYASGDQEYINIFKEIKDRWFLFMIMFLAIFAAVGFALNLSIDTHHIFFGLDLYLSIYGIAAITRSVEQIRRAEKWNRQSREYRTTYSDAFAQLPGADDGFNDKAEKLTSRRGLSWDEFKEKIGFQDGNKKSLIDQYIEYSTEQGFPITRDEVMSQLGEKIIEAEFEGEAPSVAIVIPTYQTSIEEMEALLLSIKDQAYPVDNAFVVYNDNPNDNDPEKKGKKQAEYVEFQRLVDRINETPARNNCQIRLFAQQAKGKREAMAMGFAASLGKEYLLDVKEKYAEQFRNGNIKKKAYLQLDGKINTMIANVELEKLPDLKHDFVLNIDSDTKIADPFAVLNSAILMKNNPNAGTTTGDVSVTNRYINLLSEMTYQRYWRAFFVERAAQALDGQVTCMSGPWVFMRSGALVDIFDEWYFQEFMGERTTFGDDRHISSLMLKHEWESLFTGDSKVLTDCPTDWDTFLRQQLRWNKSFNRENLFLLGFLHKMSKFVQMDVAYQQTFPFATMSIWATIIYRAAETAISGGLLAGVESVVPYGMALLLYNELFFGLYGAIKNKDPQFFKSPVYIYYYAKGLLKKKLEAYFTMKSKEWGTKGEAPSNEEIYDDFKKYIGDLGAEADEIIARAAFDAENPDEFENEDLFHDENFE